jgi:hypothetical protein
MNNGDLIFIQSHHFTLGKLKPNVAIYLFNRNLRKDLDEWQCQYYGWDHVVLMIDTLEKRLVLESEILNVKKG